MFKRKSEPITRDELNSELKGFDAFQKLSDKQFGEVRNVFNDAILKINFFIQTTNKTLLDMQVVDIKAADVITELHATHKFLMERNEILERRIEKLERAIGQNNLEKIDSLDI